MGAFPLTPGPRPGYSHTMFRLPQTCNIFLLALLGLGLGLLLRAPRAN